MFLVSINKKEYSPAGFWHQGEGDAGSQIRKARISLSCYWIPWEGMVRQNIDVQRVKNSLVSMPVGLCTTSGSQISPISCTFGAMRVVSSFGG